MVILTKQGKKIPASLVEVSQGKFGKERPVILKYLNLSTNKPEEIRTSEIEDLLNG